MPIDNQQAPAVEPDQQMQEDQAPEVELDSEEKAGLLLDVISATFSDYINQQGGDLSLDTLKDLSFSFAEDGSIKVSMKLQAEGETEPKEEMFDVSADVILSYLENGQED